MVDPPPTSAGIGGGRGGAEDAGAADVAGADDVRPGVAVAELGEAVPEVGAADAEVEAAVDDGVDVDVLDLAVDELPVAGA